MIVAAGGAALGAVAWRVLSPRRPARASADAGTTQSPGGAPGDGGLGPPSPGSPLEASLGASFDASNNIVRTRTTWRGGLGARLEPAFRVVSLDPLTRHLRELYEEEEHELLNTMAGQHELMDRWGVRTPSLVDRNTLHAAVRARIGTKVMAQVFTSDDVKDVEAAGVFMEQVRAKSEAGRPLFDVRRFDAGKLRALGASLEGTMREKWDRIAQRPDRALSELVVNDPELVVAVHAANACGLIASAVLTPAAAAAGVVPVVLVPAIVTPLCLLVALWGLDALKDLAGEVVDCLKSADCVKDQLSSLARWTGCALVRGGKVIVDAAGNVLDAAGDFFGTVAGWFGEARGFIASIGHHVKQAVAG